MNLQWFFDDFQGLNPPHYDSRMPRSYVEKNQSFGLNSWESMQGKSLVLSKWKCTKRWVSINTFCMIEHPMLCSEVVVCLPQWSKANPNSMEVFRPAQSKNPLPHDSQLLRWPGMLRCHPDITCLTIKVCSPPCFTMAHHLSPQSDSKCAFRTTWNTPRIIMLMSRSHKSIKSLIKTQQSTFSSIS